VKVSHHSWCCILECGNINVDGAYFINTFFTFFLFFHVIVGDRILTNAICRNVLNLCFVDVTIFKPLTELMMDYHNFGLCNCCTLLFFCCAHFLLFLCVSAACCKPADSSTWQLLVWDCKQLSCHRKELDISTDLCGILNYRDSIMT